MKRLAALLALIVLAVSPLALAQGYRLTIAPAATELNAQPGTTATAVMTLQNTSNRSITVAVSPRDFSASEKMNGEPDFTALGHSNQKYGISRWFSESNIRRTLTVPGNQTYSYEARFRVPQNTPERTYFGGVLFSTEDEDGATASIGGLVFITVGNPESKLEIPELTFGRSSDASKRHGVFTAVIQNSGEGLSRPFLRLKVTDESGATVTELEADGTGTILPESAREFTFTPTSELPKKNMTATLSAVDQLGKTADTSLQLDLTETPAENKPAADERSNNRAYLWFGIVPVIAILGAANRFMAYRKKTAPPTGPSPDPPVLPADTTPPSGE